jgi:hypothetical protein
MMVTDLLLGADLRYTTNADLDVGGTTQKVGNTTGIDLYSRIPMGSWALLPGLSYDLANSESDTYQIITLNVAGRWAF